MFAWVVTLTWFLTFAWFGDVQEAAQGAVSKATVLLPPTVEALPEEQAWSMVYAEFGFFGVGAVVVILALWKVLSKFIDETRAQATQLQQAQASSIKMLSEAVSKVEVAVKMADAANTFALRALTDNLGAVVVRLDKHEARLERHSGRISAIEVEHAIEDRVRRPKTLPG